MRLAVAANGVKLGYFFPFVSKKNAKLFYLHFNVLLTSFILSVTTVSTIYEQKLKIDLSSTETLIKFKFSQDEIL